MIPRFRTNDLRLILALALVSGGLSAVAGALPESGGGLAETQAPERKSVSSSPFSQPILETAGELIRFTRDVLPILAHRCFECHAKGKSKGGFSMETRERFLKGGESGPAVRAGHSSDSTLVKLVSGLDPERVMPPKGERLTQAEIGRLKAWIDSGLVWEHRAFKEAAPYELRLRPPPLPAGEGHPVDRLLQDYFQKRELEPIPAVRDRLFARRVYLDLVGLLPPAQALKSFLRNPRPDKRERLVETLLADHRNYAGHWISFWSDHLRIGSSLDASIFDNDNSQGLKRWLQEQLLSGRSFDQFAAACAAGEYLDQLAVSAGPKGEVASPAQRPEMQGAQIIAQVFLGVRLQCAACHDSFVDRWTQREAWGLASALGPGALEMVRCEIPTGEKAQPRFPFPELGEIDPALNTAERRRRVAELLTHPDNGLFARTIVNRLWARLFGHGLIEPIDEMIEHPAWHPELLEWLAAELVKQHYDLKKIIALLLTSRAYQLPAVSAVPDRAPEEFVFRGPLLRRLTAEQFVDAIRSLGSGPGAADTSLAQRAWQEANDPLMKMLGRPDRNTVVTSRSSDAFTLQALELMNGASLDRLLEETAARIATWPHRTPTEWLEELYFRLLGRPPTRGEQARFGSLLAEPITVETAEDVLWVLFMLPEFQLIH